MSLHARQGQQESFGSSTFAGILFIWCFTAFGASCLIRIAPNGLESLLFSLAFLSAIAVVFSNPIASLATLRDRSFLTCTLPWFALFGWYVSGVNLDANGFQTTFDKLFEYRLLICIPLFGAALILSRPNVQRMLVILVVSGGIGTLALWTFENNQLASALYLFRPRGSYIISGSIAGCLIALLVLFYYHLGQCKPLIIMSGVATACYVLVIDTGRTGYFQISALLLVVLWLSFTQWKQRLYSILGLLALIPLMVLVSDSFVSRVSSGVDDAIGFFNGDDSATSGGLRLQWAEFAVNHSVDNPTGIGIGNYEAAITIAVDNGSLSNGTDNLHSEFSNSLLIGGVVGLVLFISCLSSWLLLSSSIRKPVLVFGLCLFTTFVVGALFNSIFKDFGEKNLLMSMWPILIFLCAYSGETSGVEGT